MNSQILITKEQISGNEYLITALMEEKRLTEVFCYSMEDMPILGNIYLGKVKKVVQSIQAAFVEFAPGQMGYLPLGQVQEPLMSKQCRSGLITEGDELLVQVVKEAIKTKEPTLSTNISLTGTYVVLTSENKRLGISKKLEEEKRKKIKEIFGDFKTDKFGAIIRTNAGNDSTEKIFAEFDSLIKKMEAILEVYSHRTCFSCLYEAAPEYISYIRSCTLRQAYTVKTDDISIYQHLKETFFEASHVLPELYKDDKITLSSLYGLKYKILDALKEKVWLKSGAYLVIQPTEALTVIDVNSGKNICKKKKDYFLDINVEAAKEIALQLRLRNISGICIVDFINLDTAEGNQELLKAFRKYLQKDTIKTELVGMTRLGLVEITRKKIKKPLWQQINLLNS